MSLYRIAFILQFDFTNLYRYVKLSYNHAMLFIRIRFHHNTDQQFLKKKSPDFKRFIWLSLVFYKRMHFDKNVHLCIYKMINFFTERLYKMVKTRNTSPKKNDTI